MQLFIVHWFARFIEIQHPAKERLSVNPWDQPSDLRVVPVIAGNADGPPGDRTLVPPHFSRNRFGPDEQPDLYRLGFNDTPIIVRDKSYRLR